MAREQNFRKLVAHLATANAGATTLFSIDTLGWDYATVDVINTAAAATNTSNQFTSLVLQDGTTTDASNMTAISGATGTSGTAAATQFSMPINNNTSFPSVVTFAVPLGDKERYLGVTLETADTNHDDVCILATLTRGDSVLQTDAGHFANGTAAIADDGTTTVGSTMVALA